MQRTAQSPVLSACIMELIIRTCSVRPPVSSNPVDGNLLVVDHGGVDDLQLNIPTNKWLAQAVNYTDMLARKTRAMRCQRKRVYQVHGAGKHTHR